MRFRDFALRFAFGAGIAVAAGVVGAIAGERIGGILLGFPAILPASLTLIERKDGRHEAAVDATGAILGSIALIVFAAVAAGSLARLSAAAALPMAAVVWLAVALGLYALAVRLPRRKRPATSAKPTSR